MKLKVKTSSSSLESFSRKAGPELEVVDSASCNNTVRHHYSGPETATLRSTRQLTRTNSTGVESPDVLDADTLVAGNAFGTMFIGARRFGLVMTAEEMDTASKRS